MSALRFRYGQWHQRELNQIPLQDTGHFGAELIRAFLFIYDRRMTVETAKIDDLTEISKLLGELSSWLRTRGIQQWTDPFPFGQLSDEIKNGEVFILRDRGLITGIFTLNEIEQGLKNLLFLHRLGVRRSQHGFKLGRHMLQLAESIAKARGFDTLCLECHANNHALKQYYSEHGFKQILIRHHDEYDMDFAVFEKNIKLIELQSSGGV